MIHGTLTLSPSRLCPTRSRMGPPRCRTRIRVRRRHRRQTKGPGRRVGWGLFHDFVVQFHDRLAQHLEDGGAAPGQVIVPASAYSLANCGLRAQPPVPFKTLEQRVQGSGTDVVPVVAQFREHPLPDDRALSGVVEDVDFPEAQQNLARQELRIQRCHRNAIVYYGNRKRKPEFASHEALRKPTRVVRTCVPGDAAAVREFTETPPPQRLRAAGKRGAVR